MIECEIPGTGSHLARSFMKIGTKTLVPTLGDLVILWRVAPDGWQGHVGLYIGENKTDIFILGGNQDDKVKVKGYPKWQLLEYRHINV